MDQDDVIPQMEASVQPALTPEDDTESALDITRLPFDCILPILSYLPVQDVLHFLSTCRTLAAYTPSESIWRRLCTEYGINDVSNYPTPSFFTVYTKFLHPYGGLLGLWASDTPYTGNILEFRMDPTAPGECAKIVGDIWTFPALSRPSDVLADEDSEDENDPVHFPPPPITIAALQALFHLPRHPRLKRSLSIGFDKPPSTTNDELSSPADANVKIVCHGDPATIPAGSTINNHSAQIHVVVGSRQGYFFEHTQGTAALPEFPARTSRTSGDDYVGWYDSTREMPHLDRITAPEVTQHPCDYDNRHGIYTRPVDQSAPPALLIKCADTTCQHHRRPLLIRDRTPCDPLYFRLSLHVQTGIQPSNEAWTPQSLKGLWLGNFGAHGTEALYIDSATEGEDGEVVRASKVTGDLNIPRGAESWSFRVRDRMESVQGPLAAEIAHPNQFRFFQGVGKISEMGFIDPTCQCPLEIAVTGRDRIKIRWIELDSVRTYRRFKGVRKRNIRS